MTTRMWIFETDEYGSTNNKMKIDNPVHIPRVGDIIDGSEVYGKVEFVHFTYSEVSDFSLVVNVFLEKRVPKN